MDISYEIVVDFLTTNEVNYELSIRGFARGFEELKKRKCLRRLLASDIKRSGISYTCSSFVLATDGAEIDSSIDSVSSLIGSYSGSADTIGIEIRSRLNHLKGRLLRIVSEQESILSFKNERLMTVMSLEDDFCSKTSDATPAEGGLPSVERPGSRVAVLRDNGPRVAPDPDMTEAGVGNPITSVTRTHDNLFVPVYKWNLSFDGSQPLGEFLMRLEATRVARCCSKEALFRSAIDIFTGEALAWFRMVVSQGVQDWDSLVVALRKHFLPSNNDFSLTQNMYARRQGINESITRYVTNIHDMMLQLSIPLTDEQLIQIIRGNLLPPYGPHLHQKQFRTVQELVDFLVSLEDTVLKAEAFLVARSPRPRSISTLNNVSAKLQCWNCGQTGHLFSKCNIERKKFCYRCGDPLHLASACSLPPPGKAKSDN